MDALDSRETRVAGELQDVDVYIYCVGGRPYRICAVQELFHRYQKEMESHVVTQLDSRIALRAAPFSIFEVLCSPIPMPGRCPQV